MITTTLRDKLRDAKLSLVKAGWEHTCSVMVDDHKTKEYGLLFAKDGSQFFLNLETVDNLPV